MLSHCVIQLILLETSRKLLEVLWEHLDKNVSVAFLVEGKQKNSIHMFITAEWMSELFTTCLREQVNCFWIIMLRGRVSLMMH